MRVMSKVIKTRTIYGRTWEMQIVKLVDSEHNRKSGCVGKYQATYYYGADPQIWGDVKITEEGAIQSCDDVFDLVFKLKKDEPSETM